MNSNDEMVLTLVADTTMPPALREVYAGLPEKVVDYCERERVEMTEDTFEHLKRVHAKLAPYGLFKAWCEAVGLNHRTARQRVLDRQAGETPRRHARLLASEPQRIEPGDEPRDYAVVEEYPPEPLALERQDPQTAITPYQLPEPTPVAIEHRRIEHMLPEKLQQNIVEARQLMDDADIPYAAREPVENLIAEVKRLDEYVTGRLEHLVATTAPLTQVEQLQAEVERLREMIAEMVDAFEAEVSLDDSTIAKARAILAADNG